MELLLDEVSKEESWNAHMAAQEFFEQGKTDKRYLFCGSEFLFEELGASLEIWCEQEKILITGSRGI